MTDTPTGHTVRVPHGTAVIVNQPPVIVTPPSVIVTPPSVRSTTVLIGLVDLHAAVPVLTRDGRPVAADEKLTMRAGDIALLMRNAAAAELEHVAVRIEADTRTRSAAAAKRRRPIPVHLREDGTGRSVAPR